jgi:quercetin dioxygenase-like cupin family protein
MSHSIPPDDDASMVTLQQLLAEALKPVDFGSARSDALRSRLLARARASLAARARHTIVRRDDDRWSRVVDGVRVKLLSEGTGTRSVLVEFDAGAALPMHRHHEHEQCLVLRGDLQMDDLDIRAGDYHEAPAGSRHGRVGSTGGALIYLRGVSLGDTKSVVRDMLTAWLPGRGGTPRTVREAEGAWADIAPGARLKPLFEDSEEASMLLRLEPGARVASVFPGECLVIEGEGFVGDTLLRDGEYDCAQDDVQACELSSDTGALFYLHSRRRPGTWTPSMPG